VHDQQAAFRRAERVDPVRNNFQSVDIEPAVRLVENGIRRLKHGHLEDFAALLSLRKNPSSTGRAAREIPWDFQGIHLGVEVLIILDCVEILPIGKPGLAVLHG